MPSLWVDASGNLLIDGAGDLYYCEACPCDEEYADCADLLAAFNSEYPQPSGSWAWTWPGWEDDPFTSGDCTDCSTLPTSGTASPGVDPPPAGTYYWGDSADLGEICGKNYNDAFVFIQCVGSGTLRVTLRFETDEGDIHSYSGDVSMPATVNDVFGPVLTLDNRHSSGSSIPCRSPLSGDATAQFSG